MPFQTSTGSRLCVVRSAYVEPDKRVCFQSAFDKTSDKCSHYETYSRTHEYRDHGFFCSHEDCASTQSFGSRGQLFCHWLLRHLTQRRSIDLTPKELLQMGFMYVTNSGNGRPDNTMLAPSFSGEAAFPDGAEVEVIRFASSYVFYDCGGTCKRACLCKKADLHCGSLCGCRAKLCTNYSVCCSFLAEFVARSDVPQTDTHPKITH